MAWTEEQKSFSEYAIATVETGCDYAGVYLVDAITVGITQWYAYNARRLLGKLKADVPASYDKLTDRIKEAVDGHAEDESSFWTSFYLTNEDAESWKAAVQVEGNTACQDEQYFLDAFGDDGEGGYYGTIRDWGVNVDNVKSAIMWMAQYHQSPQSMLRVLQGIGGNRSLEDVRDAMLNDRIFSSYPNRINELYRVLSEWDGVSAPPDFGQSSVDIGNNPDTGDQIASAIKYIRVVNNQDLAIYGNMGTGSVLLCHYQGNGTWLPVRNASAPNAPSTGGGGSGDPADFAAMKKLWTDNERAWSYSQAAGRLNPPQSGYSDCSACIWWAANAATDNKYEWLGTSTYTMLTTATEVEGAVNSNHSLNLDKMQAGDLIIMEHSSGSQHVDWYFGGTDVWSAGSSPLPKQRSTDAANYLVGRENWVKVMRFL